MKTRFAVVTVAAVLASSLACQRGKDNKPPSGIRDAVLHEPARDVMGAQDSGHKVVIAPPRPDATEVHKTEVLKAKPQPVKSPKVIPKKLQGEGSDEILGPGETLPYKGSR